jgi:hypothetical protein
VYLGIMGGVGWLGVFVCPRLLRAGVAFHMYSATRTSGERRVVVTGAPERDRRSVARALEEAARVHRLIDHPMVPKVVAFGNHGGTPFLELDCDAVVTAQTLATWVADSGKRLAYGEADAVFTLVREAMQGAHAAIDPESGAPVCLGTLSLGNLLFSRDGRPWLTGFGHNFCHMLESGVPDGLHAVHQAHEVALGARTTPSSDYVAVLLAARAHLTIADVSAIAASILGRGDVTSRGLELFRLVRYFETDWITELPERRPSIEEAVRVSERVRALVGLPLDKAGLARRAAAEIAEHLPDREHDRQRARELEPALEDAGGEKPVLAMAKDGSWVATPHGRRRLGRAHARMLVALVRAHEAREVVDVWRLVELAWPGETLDAEAAANRVYVSLTRLRKLGLRDAIERAHGGWRIHPRVIVDVE